MNYQLRPPPMNPLSRLLAAVVGALAIVGAFFFGFFVLVAAVAVGLMLWLAMSLRIWWFKRKLKQAGHSPPPGFEDVFRGAKGNDDNADVIEAEYEVVSRKEEEN